MPSQATAVRSYPSDREGASGKQHRDQASRMENDDSRDKGTLNKLACLCPKGQHDCQFSDLQVSVATDLLAAPAFLELLN